VDDIASVMGLPLLALSGSLTVSRSTATTMDKKSSSNIPTTPCMRISATSVTRLKQADPARPAD